MKQQVLVFSLGALAAFGIAGWVRSGSAVNVAPAQFQPAQTFVAEPIAAAEPELEPAPIWREEAAPVPVRRSAQRVARRASLASDEQPAPANAEPRLKQRDTRSHDDEPQLRQRDTEQERVEAQRDSQVYRTDPVVRERSKKASIAIVAGSAAAGAAIGAAAGGGKGAAIGALAGGAGGYVYDRMTHKKRETADTRDSSVYRDTAGYRDSTSEYGDRDEDTKMDTLKRVGVGAAGGAAVGGLAGGGKGAAIGAIAGGAGGYVYDRMKRR